MMNDDLRNMLAGLWWGLVACVLLSMMCGCATRKYAAASGAVSYRADTVYRTNVVRDTFVVKDSVAVRVDAVGDTVWKTKEVWRWREKVLLRTDTVYRGALRADTIRVPVPVACKQPWWERSIVRPLLRVSCAVGAVALAVLAVSLALRYCKRKE